MNNVIVFCLLLIYSISGHSQETKTEKIIHPIYGQATVESYYNDNNILREKRIFTRNIAFTRGNLVIGEVHNFNSDGNLTTKGTFYTPYEHARSELKSGEWMSYNKQGTIVLSKYLYEQNRKHGKYSLFHESGSIMEDGVYEKGFKSGVVRRYFENGKVHKVAEYKAGKLFNIKEFYSIEGAALAFGNFKDGNGTTKLFDLKTGELLQVLTYEDGIPNIIESNTSKTEKGIVEEKTYKRNNGSIIKITRSLNGQLDGLQESLHYKGFVKESTNFVNGVKEGEYKLFHSNGKIKKTGFYETGKLSGLIKGYHDDGKIFYEETYKKGSKVGPFKKYHYSDGFMVEEGNYDDKERLTGQHNSYFGKERYLFASGEFLENKKVGIWKQYNRKGILESETNFYDLDSKKKHTKKYYIVDGKSVLKSDATHVNYVIDGVFKVFYPNGQLQETGEYNAGQRVDGDVKRYHSNGKIKESGQYKNGRSSGEWRTYNENGEEISKKTYVD